MKCAEAFDAMLVADPAALGGEGASRLAGHVRECVRCRMAATRILGGTARLANALEQRRSVQAIPVRRRRVAIIPPAAAAVAAAAALAFAILRQEAVARPGGAIGASALAETAGIGTGFDRGARQGLALTPAVDSSDSPPTVAANGAPSAASHHVRAASEAPAASEPSADDVVLPVIVDSLGDHLPEGVAVTLQPGQHAAVLHTSDPKTTIVWLY